MREEIYVIERSMGRETWVCKLILQPDQFVDFVQWHVGDFADAVVVTLGEVKLLLRGSQLRRPLPHSPTNGRIGAATHVGIGKLPSFKIAGTVALNFHLNINGTDDVSVKQKRRPFRSGVFDLSLPSYGEVCSSSQGTPEG